jgi:hypothetical protein
MNRYLQQIIRFKKVFFCRYLNGNKYEGNWKDGKIHGTGIVMKPIIHFYDVKNTIRNFVYVDWR